MSALQLPAKSLMTANPQKRLAPGDVNALGEDDHFITSILGVAQATEETAVRSSAEEDSFSLALVAEEEASAYDAPLPIAPSHLQSPESFGEVQTISPFPISVTTPTTISTDDCDDCLVTKTKEAKSRPRTVQKESFAARHRIQVETSSFPTSESSSLVHRTRRGRPSGGSVGGEFSTKFPSVPPSAPVDPRPAARRARQRKSNGSSDESYGGPEKKFKCEHCGQTFGRKEHVKRHVSGIHQQVKGKTLLQNHLCLLTCPL
jgi:hypothetical protein